MKNKIILLLWEQVSARRNICEKLRRFMRIFLEVWYKWIPLHFALRYRSRKKIPHYVATRHHTDKYIS